MVGFNILRILHQFCVGMAPKLNIYQNPSRPPSLLHYMLLQACPNLARNHRKIYNQRESNPGRASAIFRREVVILLWWWHHNIESTVR